MKYLAVNSARPSSASVLAVAVGATSFTTATRFTLPSFPEEKRPARSFASSLHRAHPGRRTAKITVFGARGKTGLLNSFSDRMGGPQIAPFLMGVKDTLEIDPRLRDETAAVRTTMRSNRNMSH